MFGFGDNYEEVYSGEHEGKFSHELVAGAASFGAMKMFEDSQRREGKAVSHAFAKELLVGFVGGEVDKLVETKGLDYMDSRKLKEQAVDNAYRQYDANYGDREQWHPDYEPKFNYQDDRYNNY